MKASHLILPLITMLSNEGYTLVKYEVPILKFKLISLESNDDSKTFTIIRISIKIDSTPFELKGYCLLHIKDELTESTLFNGAFYSTNEVALILKLCKERLRMNLMP